MRLYECGFCMQVLFQHRWSLTQVWLFYLTKMCWQDQNQLLLSIFMLMSIWVRYYSSVWYQNFTDNIANVYSRILVCSSQPRCCCFSPVKPSLLFAGMVDGSVAMWDLREPSSIHQSVVMNEETYSLRYPTYDTGEAFLKIYVCSVTQFFVYSSSIWEVIDWV